MRVETQCPVCMNRSQIEVDPQAYIDWTTGKKFVQDAFPNLSAEQREQLMTGIDGCWDSIFPAEEDGE